jgi:hypothetical protein
MLRGIRSIVAQCAAAGVACFVKQLGAQPIIDVRDDRAISGWRKRALTDRKGGDWSEWPEDLRVRQFPEVAPGRDQSTREDGPGAIAGSQQSVAEVSNA